MDSLWRKNKRSSFNIKPLEAKHEESGEKCSGLRRPIDVEIEKKIDELNKIPRRYEQVDFAGLEQIEQRGK